MRSLSVIVWLLVQAGCAASQAGVSSYPPREETITITGADGVVAAEMRLTHDDYVAPSSVSATRAEVLAVLPAAFASVGLPAPEIDAQQGLAVVQPHVVMRRLGDARLSTLLDCGRGPAGLYADLYRIRLSVLTQVSAAEAGGSTVVTRVEATAQNTGGTSGNVRCTSFGQIEAGILSAIREAT